MNAAAPKPKLLKPGELSRVKVAAPTGGPLVIEHEEPGVTAQPARSVEDERALRMTVALEVRETVLGVWRTDGVEPTQEQLADIMDAVVNIRVEAQRARDSVLKTARALRFLQLKMDTTKMRRLLETNILTIDESKASKILSILDAVEQDGLPEERLPFSFNASYEVAKAPKDIRVRLLTDGVIRPEATANQIKIAVQRLMPREEDSGDDRALTAEEKKQLRRQLRQKEQRVSKLNAEISVLKSKLGLGSQALE